MVPVDEPLPIDIVGFATLVEPTIRLAPVVAVSVSDLIKDAACNESRVSASNPLPAPSLPECQTVLPFQVQ